MFQIRRRAMLVGKRKDMDLARVATKPLNKAKTV
jgi:hypothetical protein